MAHAMRVLVITTALTAILTMIAVLGPLSNAADGNLTTDEPSRFVFTCETRESEFYKWIETVLWKKPRRFHHNLDAAIDALVSNPEWTIRIADQTCAKDAMVRSRRESLYFMIDDAHAEGAGNIIYGR